MVWHCFQIARLLESPSPGLDAAKNFTQCRRAMSWQPAYFDSNDTKKVQDTQDSKPHDALHMQLEDSPPDDSTILAPNIKVFGCIPRGTNIAYAYANFRCR